ncbi:hypothetical protein Dsin_032968 [Dipteronia sinensis]|uniref:Uncharacterized protein n=1 Tax=Dipteronia sinensis TaxID=43782 RepID=A0AAD9ZF23_9ROSI|nr:hypothetical protein Dsin_032968 [Dipteronia sinensis]
MQAAYKVASDEERLPTVKEIVNISIPYREAVIEELFRCSKTEAAISRTATVDTQLLGCHIPKGTEVFFMSNGPSTFSGSFPINEKLRTQGCVKENPCSWDPKKMYDFDPERWLREDNGKQVFDSGAGPMLTFGLGDVSIGMRLDVTFTSIATYGVLFFPYVKHSTIGKRPSNNILAIQDNVLALADGGIELDKLLRLYKWPDR